MMSVSRPMSAAHAGSYFSKDDYYLSTEGRWQGRAAEALGLTGPVSRDDFSALATGMNPQREETLVASGPGGEHRAGVDVTFSAPKSVSILSLADDRLLEVHRAAVTRTLDYIEANYAQARTTSEGVTQSVCTGNLAVAKFDHMTSREMDPQLHTHAFIMNITQRPDGEWRALSNESLYRQQLFLGHVYRSELAAQIRALGYEIQITDRGQGFFEIRGVPRALLEEFSKRREQVIAQVSALKRSGEYGNAREAKLYEVAALGSRKGKEEISSKELMQRWSEAVASKGWSLEGIRENASKEAAKVREAFPERNVPQELETVRLGAKGVTEQEAVFRKEKVLEGALKLSIGEKTIEQMEQAYRQLVKEKAFKQLGEDRRGGLFTTQEMLKIERSIVTWVRDRQGTLEAIEKTKVEGYLQNRERQGARFTEGQREAIRMVTTSRDAVTLIQGNAGAGKTAAMGAVKDVMEKEGWQVRGLAFTGKAAAELSQGSGIQSQTIASFLKEAPDGLRRREIWIVDEASMIGSKDLYTLLERAGQVEAKVVLIGDRKQFQSIQAGRMFSVLQERGAVRMTEMKEVLRQKTDFMRETVERIGGKEIDWAFSALERRGALIEIPNREERLKAVTEAYLSFIHQGKEALVLTARNEDRIELNNRIRSERVARGEIDEGRRFVVFESVSLNPAMAMLADSYKPGQVIVATGKMEGLKSGTRLEVIEIDRDKNVITALTQEKSGSGRKVEIDPAKYSDRFSIFERVERSFSEGDRVVFLKNDRKLDIQNGLLGQIEKIDDRGNIQVKTSDDRDLRFNLSESGCRAYNHLTHAYTLTEYKAQGQTVDAVIWHARAEDRFKEANTMNSFYVSITRAREEAIVFTDSKEDLKEQVNQDREKTSTLDYPERKEDEGKAHEKKIFNGDRDWDLICDPQAENRESSSGRDDPQKEYDRTLGE